MAGYTAGEKCSHKLPYNCQDLPSIPHNNNPNNFGLYKAYHLATLRLHILLENKLV